MYGLYFFPQQKTAKIFSQTLRMVEPVLHDMWKKKSQTRQVAGTIREKAYGDCLIEKEQDSTDVDGVVRSARLALFWTYALLHDVTLRKRFLSCTRVAFLFVLFFSSPQVAQRSSCQPASAHSVGNLG